MRRPLSWALRFALAWSAVAFGAEPPAALDVTLTMHPTTAWEGDTVTITVRATSSSDDVVPAEIDVVLPETLRAVGATGLRGGISSRHPRELTIEAVATTRGTHDVTATATMQGERRAEATATASVQVLRPATLEVHAWPRQPEAEVGTSAGFLVELRNTGDVTAEHASLTTSFHDHPTLARTDATATLASGEARRWTVQAIVPADAGDTLRLHAAAKLGDRTAQATATVQVLRAGATLQQRVSPASALPGHEVGVTTTVTNPGTAPLTYTLEGEWPEWVAPVVTTTTGTLLPGEAATHELRGVVRYGAPARGQIRTVLTSNAATTERTSGLAREVVASLLTLDRSTVRVGTETTGTLTLTNPSSTAVTLHLQDAVPTELRASDLPEDVRLEAGGSVTLPLTLMPLRVGVHRYEVAVFHAGGPAAKPAGTHLTAIEALHVERRTTVTLPFTLTADHADAILIGHAVTSEGTYVPGSSRLDGVPIADPRVGRNGGVRIWEVPFAPAGVLSYDVAHAAPLETPAAPEMTLLVGSFDVPIQGALTRAEAQAAPAPTGETDGWIVEPQADAVVRESDQVPVTVVAPYPGVVEILVNGAPVERSRLGRAEFDEVAGVQRLEYFGVPLEAGRNTIAVVTAEGRQERHVWLAGTPARLELSPVTLLADGRTPVRVRITALDENDLTSGFGSVTIRTTGEPTTVDAFPAEPGHQVLLRDGVGMLELEPFVRAGVLEVQATFHDLEAAAEMRVGGVQAPLVLVQGSATAWLGRDGTRVGGLARAYVEAPLGDGTLQAALDTSRPLVPVQPDGRLPVTGVGTEARPALESQEGIAVRYDRDGVTLGYVLEEVRLPALDRALRVTGLHARVAHEARGAAHAARGFVARVPDDLVTRRITPDGTREYRVGDIASAASVEVEIETGEGADATVRGLEPGRDFVVDLARGTVLLAAPLWRFTPDFEPITLIVTYAPAGTARSRVAAGAGYAVQSGTGWFLEVGALQDRELRAAARAGWENARGALEAGYGVGGDEPGLRLSGRTDLGRLAGAFGVRYDPSARTLTGRATGAVRVDDATRITASHDRAGDLDASAVLVERDLLPFRVGAGLRYEWQERAPYLSGRVAVEDGAAQAELTHAHPLAGRGVATTELGARYQLHESLGLAAGAQYRAGLGLRGTVGLTQELLGSTFTVAYQLPSASGDGNRARFGVETPLPLGEHWSVNVTAGHEQALDGPQRATSTSVAARYRDEDLTAAFGVDASVSDGDSKLVVRVGGSGNLASETVFSANAAVQMLPKLSGRFSVAHAHHGSRLTTLGDHRLVLGADPVLEGEVLPTLYWHGRGQVRTTVAYRIPLDELELGLLQVSLGGTARVLPWLGVGGAVHHLEQPGARASRTAWSVEGSVRLVEGAWFSAGYTLSGFDGLTMDTDGLYVRLDAVGGTHE